MASVYLVLKLEGMNPQYCTGFENVCVSWGVVWKIGISQRRRGISEIKIQKKKTEHSEVKEFGNNNNSIPKSKSILNKFEKGEVLRWSLRKKNPAAHTVPTWYCCVETLLKTHKKPVYKKKKKKNRASYTGLSAVSTVLSWERVVMLLTGNRLGTGP